MVNGEWITSSALTIDHSPFPSRRTSRRSSLLYSLAPGASHHQEVNDEAQAEGYEPGVRVQMVEESRLGDHAARSDRCAEEARNHGRDGGAERDHGLPVGSLAVGVLTLNLEEIPQVQLLLADDPVVRDEDAAECAHEARVSDEPGEDVRRGVGVELPRHHGDADDGRSEE